MELQVIGNTYMSKIVDLSSVSWTLQFADGSQVSSDLYDAPFGTSLARASFIFVPFDATTNQQISAIATVSNNGVVQNTSYDIQSNFLTVLPSNLSSSRYTFTLLSIGEVASSITISRFDYRSATSAFPYEQIQCQAVSPYLNIPGLQVTWSFTSSVSFDSSVIQTWTGVQNDKLGFISN